MTVVELPAGVSIRRVEPGDMIDVCRIESDVFPQPWPVEAFERYVEEPGFLVADAGPSSRSENQGPGTSADGVVGYVVADVVSTYGTEIGHVKDLAVAPGYRRRGVGAALLDSALAALAEQDVRRVKLEVRESNDAAQSLYDRFDFHLRRRLPRYYADGEDALVYITEVEA